MSQFQVGQAVFLKKDQPYLSGVDYTHGEPIQITPRGSIGIIKMIDYFGPTEQPNIALAVLFGSIMHVFLDYHPTLTNRLTDMVDVI